MKRIKFKKYIALALVIAFMFSFAGCGRKGGDAGKKIITDCAEREVAVPEKIEKICCVDPFTGPMLVMFGYGDAITTASNNMTRSVLLKIICPHIEEVVSVKSSGSLNAEEILKRGADVIFVERDLYNDPSERSKLETMNVPYVVVSYRDIEEQLEAVRVIGKVLGTEDEAEKYVSWYEGVMRDVSSVCSSVPESERLKVYHSVNEALRTDYEGSICAEWIALTGAVNVSLDKDAGLKISGDKAYTTLEQVYVWDPDLIICNEAGAFDDITDDDKWSGLRAVKEGRVYQIPIGTSRMGHPTSTETPLALLWLAELLYPERFDIDFRKEIYDYFKEYYDYELSEELIDAIIEAGNMRTEKTNKGME
ncbi:MAG: ABC transporter substrate-binding protein [Firmicutes bacterium]|nr:ABC transporter substrate-binding protein [Bacillota bacterium]